MTMTEAAFFCPTELICGFGVLDRLRDIVAPYGENGLFVMDPFFQGSETESRILKLLEGKKIVIYGQVMPNPRDVDIDKGAALCEGKLDFIVALGGGSAIDTAKAINVVFSNGGSAWDYVKKIDRPMREITKPLVPLIAIPTTAGTGTEATRYSVVTNSLQHGKGTIKTDLIFPTKSLIDAELMMSMPRKTTALTAIDAFAHAFEAYIGSKANVFSEMFSLQAMKLFARSGLRACENGNDREARCDMAMCSTLGGLAISHSATTLPHGIGQALSGVTDAPHGGSIATCMANVVRWTLPECEEKFAETACLFEPVLKEKPLREQAKALPELLNDLFQRMTGESVTMASYGLKENQVEAVADMAMTNFFGDISRHPKQASREDLIELIHSCL